jgi:hypothetical protein
MHSKLFLAIALISAVLCAKYCLAQTPAAQHKTLTPEQRKFQEDLASWNMRMKSLRVQGQSSLEAEPAREKQSLCPDADNTHSQDMCLQSEMEEDLGQLQELY